MSSKVFFKVFSIIVCILLLINLVRNLSILTSSSHSAFLPQTYVSFNSFLDLASTAPQVDMPFKFFKSLRIGADWGLFNFLRDFFNIFTSGLSVVVYAAVGAVNVILFLVYFLSFMFV